MRAKTHILKLYLSTKVSKFLKYGLGRFIFLWLVFLYCPVQTQIIMFCWREFVLASRFSVLVGTSLNFAPNSWDQPWRCTYFGAKLAFINGIFLKKYPRCMKIHFQFYFFAIWSISASILSIIAWEALASGWSPSELVMFFKIDPRCFRPFGKFHDTKVISM